MSDPARLGITPSTVLDAFFAASRGSYPTLVEARDQIGRVFRWCPEGQHVTPTLGRVLGFTLLPLTDTEHLVFEESLRAGRIRIVEWRRGGHERVLHDPHPLS